MAPRNSSLSGATFEEKKRTLLPSLLTTYYQKFQLGKAPASSSSRP